MRSLTRGSNWWGFRKIDGVDREIFAVQRSLSRIDRKEPRAGERQSEATDGGLDQFSTPPGQADG